MPAMTVREKRTVRIAAVGIAIYLALFCGVRSWKYVEARRSDYRRLVAEAQSLKEELRPYETKILLTTKLMETFHLDPAKLSKASLVAEASAAIQKAASSGGIQLGPIRESPARSSSKELASMQLEGTGPIPAVMSLLHRLQSLGYPLIVESVQINPDATKPGMVKLNLTIIILDFEQWKTEEMPNA
ncbi:MAG: hypothetical protein JWR69_1848 [Pedosphaera sp.]|nr:hypothetical protein [Pedosphaera sp.]